MNRPRNKVALFTRHLLVACLLLLVSSCAYEYRNENKYTATRKVTYSNPSAEGGSPAFVSQRKMEYFPTEKKKGDGIRRLHSLFIGVSKYQNPDYTLGFADKDALALKAFIENNYNNLRADEITNSSLVNREVTRENILRELDRLTRDLDGDDIAFLYFAGHGVKHPTNNAYFFLTWNSEITNVTTHGISWHQFDEIIGNLKRKTGSVILLIDTCHSAAISNGKRGITVARRDLSKEIDQRGLYILSVSRQLSLDRIEV